MRTLRFYDQVGLLSPSKRTESRYRLYSDRDLVRLQQILALKFLGFSLDEIKAFLEAPPTELRQALAQQRAMLTEQRDQINEIIQAIDRAENVLRGDSCHWESLVNVIRAIQMNQTNEWQKKYFTDEQLAKMNEVSKGAYSDSARQKLEAREWTEEDQKQVDQQYAALYAGVKRVVAEGQEPSSEEAQALAKQAVDLIEAFTQRDPEIEAGLQQWWTQYHQLPADQRPFQSPLSETESEFLEQAKAIYLQRRQSAGA